MQRSDELTIDTKVKVIKYLWRTKALHYPLEYAYDAIKQKGGSFFNILEEMGCFLERDRLSINTILSDIDCLHFDFGVASEIENWVSEQKDNNNSVEAAEFIGQAQLTDDILIYLLDMGAVREEDEKNIFVSLKQVTYFLLDKYGANSITLNKLNIALMILVESGEVFINEKGIRLNHTEEAREVKDQLYICDSGPTLRQEILSHVFEPKTEDDVYIYNKLTAFYSALRRRNTVRNVSRIGSKIELFEDIKYVEEAIFKEAFHWKSFSDTLIDNSILYQGSSLFEKSKSSSFSTVIEKLLLNLYYLSNRPVLPVFHDENIGKYVITRIAEIKDFPINEIKQKAGPNVDDIFSTSMFLANPYFLMDCRDFELSDRSMTCLKNANICLVGDLVQMTEEELRNTNKFESEVIREIKLLLDELDMTLGMKPYERFYL